jgi:hypothetical protein
VAKSHSCIRRTRRCVAEESLIPPNWQGWSCGSTIWDDHLNTKPSSNLLRTAVSEIGRRSFSIDSGLETFGMGVTSAHFQSEGTCPCIIDELKIWHIGRLRRCAPFFKIQLGISFGPTDLHILMDLRAFSTSSGVSVLFRYLTYWDWNIR